MCTAPCLTNNRFYLCYPVYLGLTKHNSQTYMCVCTSNGFVNCIYISGIEDVTQSGWTPLMEQAVRVIYTLSETPDVTCGNLIKSVYPKVLVTDEKVNFTMLTRWVKMKQRFLFYYLTNKCQILLYHMTLYYIN